MAEQKKELSKKETFLISLSNFLQKNRIFFIVTIIVLIVGLIAFMVVRETLQKRTEKSTILAETLQEEYEKWVTEVDDTKKAAYRDQCFERIEQILDKYPNLYASQRALFVKGNIFFEEEKWTEASDAYYELYASFDDSYLSPIALNNASVAYENNKNLDKALEMLTLISDNYKDTFIDIGKVYFSKGRLYEAQDDAENALIAYNILVDEYPNNNWTKLARNRIIALE